MNLNEMQTAWNSPQNHPSPDDRQRLADQFVRQMIRRRRFQSLWLITTFVWLTLITVVAGWTVATGQAKPGLEWGVFPLLFLPWGAAVYFLRQHRKPAASVARGESSVADSFRAALQSNQTEQSHLKLVGGLLALMIPLVALVMRQLHIAGKVSGQELTSMALFFGAALVAGGGFVAARYFGILQPRQKRLAALLKELADEGKPA